jgi:tetratricopeptide (TPR) repeat protein
MRRLLPACVLLLSVGHAAGHVAIDAQIAAVTATIAAHPDDAGLYLSRGELHRVAGDWALAESDYARASALDPDLAVVDFCRGHMLLRAGRPDAARIALDKYLGSRPDDPRARALRAEALAAVGRPREAAAEFDRALQLASDQEPLRPDWRLGRERARVAAGLDAVVRPTAPPRTSEVERGGIDPRSNKPAAVPRLIRGPYLQSATPTSVVVRWRTSVATNSTIVYSPWLGGESRRAVDQARVTDHVVRLDGLSPDTRYGYAIGSTRGILLGADPDSSFVTSPAPGAPKSTRIWVLGDSGTANAPAARVRDAYAAFTGPRGTDVWLMLGDNAYNSGTDEEYQRAVFDMYPETLRSVPLWPTFGNHDGISAQSSTQSGPYYDIFTLPADGSAGGVPSGTEAYYAFDYANIHFICLDSYESSRAPNGAMLAWLARDLAGDRALWTIAFWHHPPYSKGSHDSDREIELVEMRQNVLPILEARGVDLVLSGHSHSYERSYLIDGHYGFTWDFNETNVKDAGDGREDGDGAYVKPGAGPQAHAGAVYTVAGSSGQISGGTLDHPAMSLSLDLLGSLVIDVNGDRLDAKFLDDLGVVRDSFSIVKHP